MSDSMEPITREELWALQARCREHAGSVANEHWKRAYMDLEFAANVLDAHMGRSDLRYFPMHPPIVDNGAVTVTD